MTARLWSKWKSHTQLTGIKTDIATVENDLSIFVKVGILDTI